MIFKKDNFIFGLALGFIAPMIGFLIYKLVKFKGLTLTEMLQWMKFNPNLMLIQDSDMPAIWYHRVKKAWAESVENGTDFVNPVQERTLRWKS